MRFGLTITYHKEGKFSIGWSISPIPLAIAGFCRRKKGTSAPRERASFSRSSFERAFGHS